MLPPALQRRLEAAGPLGFAEFVDLALYDPDDGFYATGGRAGRRGDFLTSPEVGPLFGALVARMADEVWVRLGRPDPFVVADVGAGPGTLARTVRAAAPACAPALVYVSVERSAAQRSRHGEHVPEWVGEREGEALDRMASTPRAGEGPSFVSSADLPSSFAGLVVANELLDNVPFEVVRRAGGAAEGLAVALGSDGELELVVVSAPPSTAAGLDVVGAPDGAWVPWQEQARAWIADARARLQRGRLVVFDYGATTEALAHRAELGWLRTFRANERGGHPLDAPGTQDITSDVAVDQLQLDHPADRVRRQTEVLGGLGIEGLVEEGRRQWADRAHAPDVAALRARSRVREAEALTDPEGLGGFVVLEWDLDLDP